MDIPPDNDQLDLEAKILSRLQEYEGGESFEALVRFLGCPAGDVRAALYDLTEARCVRFSEGAWRLE